MAFVVNWLLTNKYARWLGLVLLAIAAAFGYGELKENQGRKDADGENELDLAKGYIDTRKRMDDAEISDDEHHAIEWLRNRNPNKR